MFSYAFDLAQPTEPKTSGIKLQTFKTSGKNKCVHKFHLDLFSPSSNDITFEQLCKLYLILYGLFISSFSSWRVVIMIHKL